MYRGAQFRAAEKDGDGMALKIFARARASPKVDNRSCRITEIEMLTVPKRILIFVVEKNRIFGRMGYIPGVLLNV